MPRDFAAFAVQDLKMGEGDFDRLRFNGIRAHGSASPDDWTLAFPVLEAYRDEWLRQAVASPVLTYADPLVSALLRSLRLDRVDIASDVAIAHKIFNG